MPRLQETNEPINKAFTNIDSNGTMKPNEDQQSQYIIEMRGGDTLQVQMSVDGARALA
ncbi:unnamed protein product, partial [Rotaria sordida]